MDRNLDGYYFRVKRNEEFYNVAFSDLTEDEMYSSIEGFDVDALKRLAVGLGKTIRSIGDELDLFAECE